MSSTDPLPLAMDLIRRPSVTPVDAGALDVLAGALEAIGFRCRRIDSGDVRNLYARRGAVGPNLCFAGHTDVVPPGDPAGWTGDPFEPRVERGLLLGRGAADMKGAIAAFVAAAADADPAAGSLSLIITGDEEGDAVDGTVRVVEALAAEGERIDHCILGEPTSAARVGDQIKTGRRGSLNAWIEAVGRQGHVAYPAQAANPIRPLIALLGRLQARVLDAGHPGFPPSNLEVTTIDVGNGAVNVIPARASARLNIRFNPAHDGRGLAAWLEEERAAAAAGFDGELRLTTRLTGDAFLTEPGAFLDVCEAAIADVTGSAPARSTTGGISDARFLKSLCPVVEIGLVGASMHAPDEHAPVEDLRALARIYGRIISRYAASFGAGS